MSEQQQLSAVERLALRQEQDALRDAATLAAEKEDAAEAELAVLDAWDAAVAKYGTKHVGREDTKAGPIILRTPTVAEQKVFERGIQRKEQLEANEKLVRAIVVYPSRSEFDRLADEWPGLCTQLGDLATDLAAITGNARKKG
jgi:hypothetical protein